MGKKELICIICPLGCRMQVEKDPDGNFAVRGQKCKRGKVYAIEECTFPTRVVTSTVVIHNAILPRLPVKTAGPIPKDLIMECMKEIAAVELFSPVEMGHTVIKNVLDTGVDVVATRSMS